MIEGTSDPFGRIWSANVVRKMDDGEWGIGNSAWKMEALVFSTNFRSGLDIEEFQNPSCQNYIHSCSARRNDLYFCGMETRLGRDYLAKVLWTSTVV